MSESDDTTKKSAPPGPTTSQDGPRWAADEPTAMWDDGALRDKGYEGVSDVKATPRAPATGPDVGGADAAKVQLGSAASATTPPARGLSWPSTVVLATVVAVIVYFVVRMIR